MTQPPKPIKLRNILPLVKRSFPKDIKTPVIAESLWMVEDKQSMVYALNEACAIWGSDCVGGLAYFGKTQDMEKIQEQSRAYLSYLHNPDTHTQFYMLWQLGEYSLLTLYEDYPASAHNPYPVMDNVLCVFFGAWCDDDLLPQVLEDQKYITETDHWLYGGDGVDLSNTAQANLLEEMKKAVACIGVVQDVE